MFNRITYTFQATDSQTRYKKDGNWGKWVDEKNSIVLTIIIKDGEVATFHFLQTEVSFTVLETMSEHLQRNSNGELIASYYCTAEDNERIYISILQKKRNKIGWWTSPHWLIYLQFLDMESIIDLVEKIDH